MSIEHIAEAARKAQAEEAERLAREEAEKEPEKPVFGGLGIDH